MLKKELRSIKTNTMHKPELVFKRGVHEIKFDLEDGEYYLCIEIQTEWGRGGTTDTYIIFMGRYSKNNSVEPYSATFHDVTMMEYTFRNRSVFDSDYTPSKPDIYNLNGYWSNLETYDTDIHEMFEIYKLQKRPNKQLISELKREIEKMKWAPVTTPGVSFVGEHFREALDNAVKKGWGTETVPKSKGGKTRKNRMSANTKK